MSKLSDVPRERLEEITEKAVGALRGYGNMGIAESRRDWLMLCAEALALYEQATRPKSLGERCAREWFAVAPHVPDEKRDRLAALIDRLHGETCGAKGIAPFLGDAIAGLSRKEPRDG